MLRSLCENLRSRSVCDQPEQILAREGHLTVRRWALPCPCLAPAYEHLGHEIVPARLVASLMIPVCSATLSYASGSSDSQLEPCLDRLGIGRLDWRLPSMPYVQTLTMSYASI